MQAKDHYDKHLSYFYSWMTGDFNQKQSEQEIFFRDHAIGPFNTRIAFDLGCGHGLQAVSLARIGFSVKAVDFNAQLLNELSCNSQNLSIEIIHNDILSFLEQAPFQADVIVCMGDTLTHLNNMQEVEKLVQLSVARLAGRGKIIFSFRDLTLPLSGEDRFIPVKQDDDKMLTCFLEYFPDYVMVHDILHVKQNGRWQQKISAYPKLRLSEQMVLDILLRFEMNLIQVETINRMVYIITEKLNL